MCGLNCMVRRGARSALGPGTRTSRGPGVLGSSPAGADRSAGDRPLVGDEAGALGGHVRGAGHADPVLLVAVADQGPVAGLGVVPPGEPEVVGGADGGAQQIAAAEAAELAEVLRGVAE